MRWSLVALVAASMLAFGSAVGALTNGETMREAHDWSTPLARHGDLLTYEILSEPSSLLFSQFFEGREAFPGRWRVETLASQVVHDGAHVPKTVDAYSIAGSRDGKELDAAVRCYANPGRQDAVRIDSAVGNLGWWYHYQWSQGLHHDGVDATTFEVQTLFGGDCLGRNPFPGHRVREGEALPASFLRGLGLRNLSLIPAWSAAARPETIDNARALTYTFESATPGLVVVASVVEVSPGVKILREVQDGREVARMTLTEFNRGTGPALKSLETEEHASTRDSGRAESDGDRLTFDDRALGVPYPFREAFDNVRNDPMVCLGRFLSDHPGAFLASATYSRTWRDPALGDAPNEGGWWMTFHSGGKYCTVSTARFLLELPAIGTTDLRPVRNQGSAGSVSDVSTPSPSGPRANSIVLADRARAQGIAPNQISMIMLRSGAERDSEGTPTILLVAPPPAGDGSYGKAVILDASSGKLQAVLRTQPRSDSGFIAPVGRSTWQPSLSPAVVATSPFPEANQALALAGLVALAVAVKLSLFLLSNRIPRDRVLDHPRRAAIIAMLKAEPGLHQAAIVTRAGGAYGSTLEHLRRLTELGFIRTLKDGGYLRYHAVEDYPTSTVARLNVLKRGRARDVHAFFLEQPRASLSAAAKSLKMSAPSVHRAKKRLVSAGLLPKPTADEPGTSGASSRP